jgi:hypothetical protein
VKFVELQSINGEAIIVPIETIMVCRSTEQGTEILFKEGGAAMVLGTVSEVVKKLNGPVLTKREQFAAMAMQELCGEFSQELSPETIALLSLRQADALIQFLEN